MIKCYKILVIWYTNLLVFNTYPELAMCIQYQGADVV